MSDFLYLVYVKNIIKIRLEREKIDEICNKNRNQESNKYETLDKESHYMETKEQQFFVNHYMISHDLGLFFIKAELIDEFYDLVMILYNEEDSIPLKEFLTKKCIKYFND